VRGWVCACVRAYVQRACVRALGGRRVRACVRMCGCVGAWVRAWVRACVSAWGGRRVRACMGESWPAVADPPSSVPAFQSTCRTSFSSRRNWAGPGGPHASAASPGCVVPHCGHFRRFGAICHSQPSFWQPFFGCRRGFPLRPLMAARRQQQVQTKTRLATTTSNGPSARGTRRAGTRTRPPVRRSRRAGGGVRGDDPRRRPARDDPRRRGDDPSRPWRRMATLRFKSSSRNV
jgi:hypothetical protein